MSATSLAGAVRSARISSPPSFIAEAEARYDSGQGWTSAAGWCDEQYRKLFHFAAEQSYDNLLVADRVALADFEFLMDQSPMPFAGHSVYTLFDANDALLYVGQTKNVWRRVGAHATKPWGGRIETVRVLRCATHAEALEVEARLILDLRPRHNIVHNWRSTPIPPVQSSAQRTGAA